MRRLLELVELGDVVDILLVTVLVYTAVVWIRRTQAAFVAIGLFLLAVLYVLAEAFDLQLTTAIFRSFFAISVVIIVVLFQEELRQLFERLGVWSLRRGRSTAARAAPADMLVEALTDMARQHVGALVVLPGTQPIARHVRGGLPLDGVLSVPLCIVSSEERGEISIARDGRLRRLSDSATLTAELDRFLREVRPGDGERQSFWSHLIREHWSEKVASLLFVSALWLAVVPGARPLERTFKVPVEVVNLPSDLVLAEVKPREVQVKLSGLRREFYLFNPRFLRIMLDAHPAGDGQRTFPVQDSDLHFPKSLTLDGIEPDTVRIKVRRAESTRPEETPAQPE